MLKEMGLSNEGLPTFTAQTRPFSNVTALLFKETGVLCERLPAFTALFLHYELPGG